VVAASIPDEVIGIFELLNPSCRTLALESTWPLIAINTSVVSEGKGGRCVGRKTSPPSRANCVEFWEPERPEFLRACPGLFMDCFRRIKFKRFVSRWLWAKWRYCFVIYKAGIMETTLKTE